MKRVDPALLVVLAGVSAALHVGKLPPALPVLREALGISLLEAGFLLSLVQLAGMTLGLVCGLLADTLGLRRTMTLGLAVLSAASFAGGWAAGAGALLVLRAVEGLGFLLAAMPAPGLIRRVVAPAQMNRMLGLWGAYMPLGTALALLLGPAVMATAGWPAWWWGLGLLSAMMAAWLWIALPAHCDAPPAGAGALHGMAARVGQTLAAPGPWLVALAFAVYSAQWLSVIGFLPSVYAQAGVAGGWAAVATALAAGVNMIGNVGSGRLLQRGAHPARLLHWGYAAMLAGALLAFAPWWQGWAPAAESALRYTGVLLFSAVGGMVPGTLFAVAVRLAPHEGTVSTTIGWMQQWSALGQFAGPPVAAWVAGRTGGWSSTWVVTGACALAGMLLATRLVPLLRSRP